MRQELWALVLGMVRTWAHGVQSSVRTKDATERVVSVYGASSCVHACVHTRARPLVDASIDEPASASRHRQAGTSTSPHVDFSGAACMPGASNLECGTHTQVIANMRLSESALYRRQFI